jgi:hypothetical protein
MDFLNTILDSAGEYAVVLVRHLVRIATIFLAGLGVVSIITKQLGIPVKKKTQTLIGMGVMLLTSIIISILYHYSTIVRLLWESLVFWVIGNVVYMVLGYHFYNRMDNFLDKKIGEN